MDKSISYSQRIFAAYAESGHFLVDHYIGQKEAKMPKHFEHYPTTNHELFVLNYVPHYSFSNSGMWKGQNSPVCFTALFTAFSFAGHFLHFISVGKVFFANPEDGEIVLKEVQVWVLVKQDFHRNFLIIIITRACLTEQQQNWTTTNMLHAGTTVYSNMPQLLQGYALSSTSSLWSLTFNTLGDKKNLTLYFIKLK